MNHLRLTCNSNQTFPATQREILQSDGGIFPGAKGGVFPVL
jgi:hypothetical protein